MKAVAISDSDFTQGIVSPEGTQTDDSVLEKRNDQSRFFGRRRVENSF